MSFMKKLIDFIAKASLPLFKFENNQLCFKLKEEDYFLYDLNEYEIKTRHDSYVREAYTIKSNDIFLEYIKLDSNVSWKGQALSIYEGFLKQKLHFNYLSVLENIDISNYNFKVYKVDENFIFHIIYIYSAVNDIIIIDSKGELYKNLLFKMNNKYNYKFINEEKGDINFNISIVKENAIRGYFSADD